MIVIIKRPLICLSLLTQSNPNVFKSVGKGGGTILYKYIKEIETFQTKVFPIALDYMSDGKMIYLPTKANETKESWDDKELFQLTEMPETVIILLNAIKAKTDYNKDTVEHKATVNASMLESTFRLAPLLQDFIKNKVYSPSLFRIITPKSMRDIQKYQKLGHLHPNDVPKGRGSEYLSRISCILGADPSVDIQMYLETMELINSMWDEPMDLDRLHETITNRMIASRVEIDGKPVWIYDKHWDTYGFQFLAKNGEFFESFFDDVKGIYFAVNYTKNYIKQFDTVVKLMSFVKTVSSIRITEQIYNQKQILTRTVLEPHQPFGRIDGTDKFNMFRQNEYLAALNGAKENYENPITLINFFNTFIPDDDTRDYVLRFMRTKLTEFKYSPVILHIVGTPGSGKDLFCSVLSTIIGDQFFRKPEVGVFKEKHNSWLLNAIFAQCDEYADTISFYKDKVEVLGKLKGYSGSPRVNIRAMFQDSSPYEHRCSFILTANANPLPIDVEDRRFCCIKTGGALNAEEWVKNCGGMTVVYNQLFKELEDFCAYLHHKYKNLSSDEYQNPPQTMTREEVLYDNLTPLDLIVRIFRRKDHKKLIEMYQENGITNFKKGWKYDRVYQSELMQLLSASTKYETNINTFHSIMSKNNMKRSYALLTTGKQWYYSMDGLSAYVDEEDETPITNVKSDGSEPKGITDV